MATWDLQVITAFLEPPGEGFQVLSGKNHLPGWHQVKLDHLIVEGTLADGIEGPDLFEFITEKGQPHRLLEHRREKIDQVTTHGEAAPVLDQRDPLITKRSQALEKLVTADLLADFKLQDQGIESAAWQDFLLQSLDRGDNSPAATCGECRQS